MEYAFLTKADDLFKLDKTKLIIETQQNQCEAFQIAQPSPLCENKFSSIPLPLSLCYV